MKKLILGLVIAAALTVGACSSPGEAPEITPTTQAELTTSAIDDACGDCRYRQEFFVHDELFSWGTLLGDEEPMPQAVRDHIAAQFPNATFVSSDETDALFVDGIVINDGVIINVGPIEDLAPNVVGIDVGVTSARDGGRAETVLFRWNGNDWELATSEETGVTVTTAVS